MARKKGLDESKSPPAVPIKLEEDLDDDSDQREPVDWSTLTPAERKKERNRIAAREARIRKKKHMAHLETRVREGLSKNANLKRQLLETELVNAAIIKEVAELQVLKAQLEGLEEPIATIDAAASLSTTPAALALATGAETDSLDLGPAPIPGMGMADNASLLNAPTDSTGISPSILAVPMDPLVMAMPVGLVPAQSNTALNLKEHPILHELLPPDKPSSADSDITADGSVREDGNQTATADDGRAIGTNAR
jgi:hypothetical protein